MRAFNVALALGAGTLMWALSSADRVRGQAASPSVRQAARLKYNPPPNWIRHYLGDDRYKIAGGAWKVVSTETDTYYYPAWAPEMLRQSNGIVIGFPSAAAAEEAGYKRSKYPMESPLLGLTGRPQPTPIAPPAAAAGGGFSLPQEGLKATVNRGKAQRVVLADGTSTTILPGGWTHLTQTYDVPQNRQTVGGQQLRIDIFGPGALDAATATRDPKARIVAFGFIQMPAGTDASAAANRMGQVLASSASRSGASGVNATARPGGFGDVRGVVVNITLPRLGSVPLVYAGRGSKMYLLYDGSRGAKGSRDIIRGFKGR